MYFKNQGYFSQLFGSLITFAKRINASKHLRNLGCDLTQQIFPQCIYLHSCYQLDPFFFKNISIGDKGVKQPERPCKKECQKIEQCDFWSVRRLIKMTWKWKISNANLGTFKISICRKTECVLYHFPYSILPNEMLKQEDAQNLSDCTSGPKFCCK